MESNPDLKLHVSGEPVGFETTATGSFKAEVSAIAGSVEEIPIRLVIPFRRCGRSLQTIASVGGFGVRINPITVSVEGAGVTLEGVLGIKGIRGTLEGKIGCKSKLDVAGKLFGKIATCTLELPEDEIEGGVDLL
jgi:hypothetical protein